MWCRGRAPLPPPPGPSAARSGRLDAACSGGRAVGRRPRTRVGSAERGTAGEGSAESRAGSRAPATREWPGRRSGGARACGRRGGAGLWNGGPRGCRCPSYSGRDRSRGRQPEPSEGLGPLPDGSGTADEISDSVRARSVLLCFIVPR